MTQINGSPEYPGGSLTIPGVMDVIEVPATGARGHVRNGVAVVANDTWRAIRARNALEIQWNEEGASSDDSSELRATLLELVARPGKLVTDRGNAPEVIDRHGSTVGRHVRAALSLPGADGTDELHGVRG